jgi:hypothetical protein
VPLAARSGNTQGGAIIADAFQPVSARYARLRVESAHNCSDNWVSIREF